MADSWDDHGEMDNGYVPIRDREVDEHNPKQNYAGMACPQVCGPTRKSMDNFYPGPTILMHKMHWTEWVFVLFIIISAVLMVLSEMGMVPVAALCGLSTCISACALCMVWGIARYQSLAAAADQLEDVAMKNHAQIAQVQAINNEWENSVKEGRENLDKFTEQLGFIDEDAKQIDEIQKALQALVVEKKRIQLEEKLALKISIKYQRISRAEINEKKRAIMKARFRRQYERLVRRGEYDVLQGEEELKELENEMAKDPFLNSKDEKTGEPLFDWKTAYIQIAEDGEVPCWELLDALDMCTGSYFYEIRDSLTKEKDLEEQLLRQKSEMTQKNITI